MVSGALISLAAAQLACVAWLLVKSGRHEPIDRARWLIIVVGCGLAYDSAVFGAGALLGEGTTLRVLSVLRFVAHVVLTPLLVVWAGDRVFRERAWWVWPTVVCLIAWGAVADLLRLNLVPRTFADTLRYTHLISTGPPIAALAVTVVLLIAGVRLWRQRRWVWLLAGVIALTAASAVAPVVPPLGNAGEGALLITLVATEVSVVRRAFAREPTGSADSRAM
ncbi:hypothetical protein [Nocardia sp. NPDC056100]|uniref:hypothetical protein n=1 Tax=Nocardia sp. NPDC056100 TaxID=3345712 RepID=UPI0035D965BA